MKSAWLLLPAVLLFVFGGAGSPDAKSRMLFNASDRCLACHNGLVTPGGMDVSIGTDWQPSMMANSSRDPYWQAAVRREVLDHPAASADIENECAICHMPMAAFESRTAKQNFGIFAHLPGGPNNQRAAVLAADGVSCALCHQIQNKGLGQKESFTGGFAIDALADIGRRLVLGPYAVDTGQKRMMQSSSDFAPEQADHVTSSELCASCHTLYTHALGEKREVLGQLPEQVPYLEWRHSGYNQRRSCQSCHMPAVEGEMPIASVLGQPRERLARHVFRAANFFMPRIFARFGGQLSVAASLQELEAAARRTEEHLETSSARLAIEDLQAAGDTLQVEISIKNLAGHKLPSGYPSRRAWVRLAIRDRQGRTIFESGALRSDGSIKGNDNDAEAFRYETHYGEIDDPERVQIYEAIMADGRGRPTTGLLSGLHYIKDNRLLPRGFNKSTAPEDVGVQGDARADENFTDGGDRIRYSVALKGAPGPYTIQAELWYQPIGYRWAQNLRLQKAEETDRFVSLYQSMAEFSALVLARAEATVPKSTAR